LPLAEQVPKGMHERGDGDQNNSDRRHDEASITQRKSAFTRLKF